MSIQVSNNNSTNIYTGNNKVKEVWDGDKKIYGDNYKWIIKDGIIKDSTLLTDLININRLLVDDHAQNPIIYITQEQEYVSLKIKSTSFEESSQIIAPRDFVPNTPGTNYIIKFNINNVYMDLLDFIIKETYTSNYTTFISGYSHNIFFNNTTTINAISSTKTTISKGPGYLNCNEHYSILDLVSLSSNKLKVFFKEIEFKLKNVYIIK